MKYSNEELIAKLESDDIEDVILSLDIFIVQTTLLLNKSLASLKKHKEWRSYIAERIFSIISKPKVEMSSLYAHNSDDDDLVFWLSTLLIEYDENHYENILMDYARNHKDGKEMLALTILAKKEIIGLDKIIINKIGMLEFNKETFDLLNFYLDRLKMLDVVLPSDIAERISCYNEGVQEEWQKLSY
ncbi:hypothetical protein [Chitinophaga sp. 212800010-3]|uniref:hypothetical protein n=1 Tax=unclassified Chitinophaga TaxID=2619133 RepID=UPI002DEE20AB|nr:hypothetical protein [Chitinophaga sp. 212800010-3]